VQYSCHGLKHELPRESQVEAWGAGKNGESFEVPTAIPDRLALDAVTAWACRLASLAPAWRAGFRPGQQLHEDVLDSSSEIPSTPSNTSSKKRSRIVRINGANPSS
jgi:hypothetical protein